MSRSVSVKTISLQSLTCVLIAGGFPGVSTLPTRADVAITAQHLVTTSDSVGTGQTPPAPQTVKLFFQGPNARLEVPGEPTLLEDGKGNIIYGLNPASKTYYMTVPTEIEPADSMSPGGGSVKEDTKLDLTQTTQTMTLAGQTAQRYTVSGTVTFTRSRPEGRGGGRHRRGGGGFPLLRPTQVDQDGGYGDGQRGGNGGGGEGGSMSLPQWSLSGEIWLSQTIKFPAKENTVFAAQLVAAGVGPFQQPLADALDKHKGLPLLARLTVTHTPASSHGRAINQYGGVVEGQDDTSRPAPVTTATTWTVQSISTGALSDAIFQAPLDYTLVAAPLDAYSPGAPLP